MGKVSKLLLGCLGLVSFQAMQAADRTWNNAGTDFNTGTNWTGGLPGTGDRGVFSAAVGNQPNLSSSLTIQGLSFTATGYNLTSSNTSTALTLTNTGTTTTTAALNLSSSLTATIDAPIVLGAAAATTQTFLSGSGASLTLNGVISSTNAIAGLTLGSTGTYTINGANTYSGTTTQSAGNRIIIGNAQAFSAGTLTFQSASGGLQAGINLTGSNKISNNIIWGASATLFDSGANAIQFAGTVSLNGAAQTIISQISAGATFDGVISNDNGGGLTFMLSNGSNVTLTGTNTYTGNTVIRGTGAVRVSSIGNAGANGNLGAGTTINLGATGTAVSGTLIYTGTGESTSKVINLNGTSGGAVIEHAGTGNLTFTANSTATGLGNKTLTLMGSTSGVGQFQGQIVNSAGNTTSLTKDGTGRWVITGANTYTGATTINAGVLEASDGVGLTTASILQLRGGVLQTSGTITRTLGLSSGNVNWQSGSGGFAAKGGNLILNLNGGTGSLTWGSTSTQIGGSELIFGSSTADSLVDLQNAGALNGAIRTIRVNDNASSSTDIARISGVLSGSGGGITKEGVGVLELTGTNTYTGATTVNAGTLLINGNMSSATGAVAVNSGGTLGGSGTLGGAVTVNSGGTISAGNSPGVLTVASLNLESGSSSVFELAGTTRGTQYDGINVGGALDFDGTLSLAFTNVSAFSNSDVFDLFNFSTSSTGDFQSLVSTGFYAGTWSKAGEIWSFTSGGQLLSFSETTGDLTFSAVPEPSTYAMLAMGLGALLWLRRRSST
jgi:fibronectin-binding autotransporter adhesin